MGQQEATDPEGHRLVVGYGPVGVGEGDRRLLVLLAQATERLSGRAGRVAHALPDLATALQQAATLAQPGEVVVLSPACASYDQYPHYEARFVTQADTSFSKMGRSISLLATLKSDNQ